MDVGGDVVRGLGGEGGQEESEIGVRRGGKGSVRGEGGRI